MKRQQRDSGLIVAVCVMLGLCLVLYVIGFANKPLLTANDRNAAVGVRPDARVDGIGRAVDPSVYSGMQETGHPVKSTHGGVVAFTANVSAYCPLACCCGEYADGITASGHVIQPGDKFVAAPKHIPFGTMIDIPGYGRVPVLDRGGAIVGNKLDVFFGGPDGHQNALNFGRQILTVTIER